MWELLDELVPLFDKYEEAAKECLIPRDGSSLAGLLFPLADAHQAWSETGRRIVAEVPEWCARLAATRRPELGQVAAQLAGLASRVEQALSANRPTSLGERWAEARADLHALPPRLVQPSDDLRRADISPAEKPELVGGSGEGPEAGCCVRYGGQVVEVKGRIYAVIAFMWKRESASFDELKAGVNDEVGDNTIHTWANRANNALAGLPLSWKLVADGVNRVVRKEPRGPLSTNLTSETAL